MNTPEFHVFSVVPDRFAIVRHFLSLAARLAFVLAIVAGCTYLVFWRGESAWLYALAVFLLRYRSAF